MGRLSKDARHRITFILNARERVDYVEPRLLLSDFLRQQAGATGVHVGCEHGVCGACTVRVDGALARACLMLAVQIDGAHVETIEGLAPGPGDNLSDLQQAFKKHFALQCGYCTPGILISAQAFLEQNREPDEAMVRDMLSGHLCRCTGYTGIVHAILEVAAERARHASGQEAQRK